MPRLLLLIGLLVTLSTAGTTDAWAQSTGLVAAVVKSPVTPDGNVAGRPTDINVILGVSLDPQVPGKTLLRGRTIKVTLPDGFRRNPDVPAIDSKDQGFLVKGWPQGDVRRGDYAVSLEGERTQIFTATDDIAPGGRMSRASRLCTSVVGRSSTHRPASTASRSRPRPGRTAPPRQVRAR